MMAIPQIRKTVYVVTMVMISAGSTLAQTLSVGDQAPVLSIHKWIVGEEVNTFEKGQVYVVEFSAVRCPPCMKTIPHLTAMAEKYSGKVTVISVYTKESNVEETTNLRHIDQVNRLVHTLGDKIKFTVAVDVPLQATANLWQVKGTPDIFIIDQLGRIAWRGSNGNAMEEILPEIIFGNFDVFRAQRETKEFYAKVTAAFKLKRQGQYREAVMMMDTLEDRYHSYKGVIAETRFKLLIGDDDTGAYKILSEMINDDPGVAWDKLLQHAYVEAKHPDYVLVLKAADHGLQQAETARIEARIWTVKASVLRHKGWRVEAKQRRELLQQAVKFMEKAVERSKSWGDAEFAEHINNQYCYFKYLALVGSNEWKANAFIRWMLTHNINPEWSNLISESLTLQKHPDYKVLILVADKIAGDAKQRSNIIEVWSAVEWKAKIYVAQGNISEALRAYEMIIEQSRSEGNTKAAVRFEAALAALKQKT